MGDKYNPELEREYRRYRSIEGDYFAVLSSLETLKKIDIDLTPYMKEFRELENRFYEARLRYNIAKNELIEKGTATNQRERDKREAELLAIDQAA